ncbi:MAG: ATP-dependent helicase/deoxyribonuclease subunit [Pseudomonadota bacterium]|jgi:probable DNA repair protein
MHLSERLKDIPPGTVVLTPNQRMTVWLQKACYLPHVSIFPLSLWIERLWQQAITHNPVSTPKILSGVAEEIVWERVISKALAEKPLLRVLPTVRLAIKAWHLVKTWDISLDLPQFNEGDASTWFVGWAKQVEAFCLTHGWIDIPSLVDALILLLSTGHLLLPKRCVWLGFSEHTPQQKRLISALSGAGVQISHSTLISEPSQTAQNVACQDTQTELMAALAWAKASLQADSSPFSTAIVVPQLATERARVLRAVKKQLPLDVVNIAAPRVLSEYAFIQAALQALSLAKPSLEWATVSRYLRALSYVDAQTEQHTRAQLELALRDYGMQTVSWKQWLYQSKRLKVMQTRLQQLFHLKNTALKSKKTAKEWVPVLREWLQIAGWPMMQTLSAEEEALLRQWEAMLEQYESLDNLLGKHSISTAIFRIQGLTSTIAYAVASRSEPIQILGLWEAIGLPFKRVWVMGLDSSTWPKDASPNPFIPYRLQKQFELPHSAAEREYLVAQRVVQDLLKSASTVFFSHPLYRDGHPVLPSRLLSHFPYMSSEWLSELLGSVKSPMALGYQENASAHIPSDKLEYAPPFTALDTVLAGGTRVLKLQNTCPFKAFAEIRLKASAWPEPYLGLSPAQRGVMVHELLAQLWGKIKTHEQLCALSEPALRDLLGNMIQETLERWQTLQPHRLSETTMALEYKRLMGLLLDWVSLEKQRPPFAVLSVEKHQVIVIQGLTLKICIDRIDILSTEKSATASKTDTEKQLIIDYKTGRGVSTQAWLGDVLLEPQLPLYATTQSVLPDAIAFAIVHPETAVFRGLGSLRACQGIKEITEWTDQLAHWKNALEDTVSRFLSGDARVLPHQTENPCNSCHLTALCRVFE